MAKQLPDEAQAKFEAMLSQVLTTEEEARGYRAAKGRRDKARQQAVNAKAIFDCNRSRPPKQHKRSTRRET